MGMEDRCEKKITGWLFAHRINGLETDRSLNLDNAIFQIGKHELLTVLVIAAILIESG
jgi:hypothetical protein